jgi:hypothetical protein
MIIYLYYGLNGGDQWKICGVHLLLPTHTINQYLGSTGCFHIGFSRGLLYT